MHKLLFRIITILVLLLGAVEAKSQSDAQYTQFYEVPSLYNPAATGLTDYIRIRGGARLQWVGIDGAPKTFSALADMPFKIGSKRLSTGLNVMQESIGLYSSLNFNAQIGYKLKKFGGEFTGGLQIGMYDQKFRGSEVVLPDGDDYHQSGDEAIPTTDLHGTALDLAAGLWYKHKHWEAGLSATHLTAPHIKMGGEGGAEGSDANIYEFNAPRTIYFIAQGNIPVKNTLFEVLPSLMVKTTFTFTSAELMARARYNKFLIFGIGYRWDDAITATLAAEIKNFYIGYSFDYATGAIHSASSGSHEIVVGYSLKLNLGEKNRNRHRSVRFM